MISSTSAKKGVSPVQPPLVVVPVSVQVPVRPTGLTTNDDIAAELPREIPDLIDFDRRRADVVTHGLRDTSLETLSGFGQRRIVGVRRLRHGDERERHVACGKTGRAQHVAPARIGYLRSGGDGLQREQEARRTPADAGKLAETW